MNEKHLYYWYEIHTNGSVFVELCSIGQKVRFYRKAAGLRQEALAEAAGISTNYLGMIERGEKIPSLETFLAIANALSVSSDLLLADVLKNSYEIKASLLSEKLKTLSDGDRDKIYAVIDAMVEHSK